jgi:hypothetical protein
MTEAKVKKTVFLLVSMAWSLILVAQDTAGYHGKAGVADVADTDPGLFMAMMFILIGFIGALLLGIIALLLTCLVLFLLTSAGIVSVSLFMGLYHRSLKTGIKTLIFSVFSLFGVVGGAAGYLLFSILKDIPMKAGYTLGLSMLAGLGGGLLTGWLFSMLFGRFYSYLGKRFRPSKPRAGADR